MNFNPKMNMFRGENPIWIITRWFSLLTCLQSQCISTTLVWFASADVLVGEFFLGDANSSRDPIRWSRLVKHHCLEHGAGVDVRFTQSLMFIPFSDHEGLQVTQRSTSNRCPFLGRPRAPVPHRARDRDRRGVRDSADGERVPLVDGERQIPRGENGVFLY